MMMSGDWCYLTFNNPQKMISIFCLFSLALAVDVQSLVGASNLMAGTSKIDMTPPLGVPLAGYNHGARRVPYWPIPDFGPYTTWMTGNKGRLANDGIFARALVVVDAQGTKICFVAIDAIGSDATLNQLAFDLALNMGFSVPFENVVIGGSHSHSGPGAISPDFLWSVAPATDILVGKLQREVAMNIAKAMVEAEKNLQPAKLAMGNTMLLGVTKNRRAKESPYLNSTTIDPHVALIRVDSATGVRMATVWNFAIHGVCYGPSNMHFSGDIMGVSNRLIEEKIGGHALFINADAGDIDPADGMCDNKPTMVGSVKMANAVIGATATMTPTTNVQLKAYTHVVDFGPTNLNATLGRFDNCTQGGPLDICTICRVLGCDANVHMPSSWLTNAPRFTAIEMLVNNDKNIVVTMPGEPLLQLGWWVRNDTLNAGYTGTTLLAGYAQAHMGYFATPREYVLGGYESQLTFWGISTAEQVRNGVKKAFQGL